ncbi:MAG TPA: hypothetical protein PKC74_07940 [Turneriella sp.]|nr:hypothetical protein [Turneriella sp.]
MPPADAVHIPRRWRRPRFWLKLGALLFAAAFTATTIWFILRAEQFILSRLPREIQASSISVSFLGRSFVLKGVRVSGRMGSPCEGRLLFEIAELTGQFVIRERRLTSLEFEPAFDLDAALSEARQMTGRDDAAAHLATEPEASR